MLRRVDRTGAWVKVRQMTVVDAVVVGVSGPVRRPGEVVLARRDNAGQLRRIGLSLSLPLPPRLGQQIGERVTLTGEPARWVAGSFGQGRTEYRPVLPELVVEVQAEGSVMTFTSRCGPGASGAPGLDRRRRRSLSRRA